MAALLKRVTFEKTLLRYPHLWLGRRQVMKNGFWFVDVPRCSSTSIRAELAVRFGRAYGGTSREHEAGKVRPYLVDHIPAQTMRQVLPKGGWEKIFTFALVRNPWDRLVSLFYHRKQVGNLPQDMAFGDFVRQLEHPRYMLVEKFHSSPIYFMPMVDFLCDQDDQLMVSFVGRYERRKEDLGRIGERIGCPELGDLRISATSSGREESYVEEYDEETAALVSRFYADDIERFGYRFGD